MFVRWNKVQTQVAELVDRGRQEEALSVIVSAVQGIYRLPEVAHHALYFPELDQQIERVARQLPASAQMEALHRGKTTENTLIVATELYSVGGHSRVIADLLREIPSATLVLTDLFHRYRQQPLALDAVHEQFPDAQVIALNHASSWRKCQQLYSLVARLRPRSILYLQHHQDPVAFVGTIGHGGAAKWLIHHCDHNPSLGCTLADLGHVDLTEELGAVCRQHLQRSTMVLPLHVPDLGCRTFSTYSDLGLSVVTAGTDNKFSRKDPPALQDMVSTTLRCTTGNFFHIGPLPEDWESEIRRHLLRQDLNPSRFVTLGPVPSLWQTLGEIDAHVYLSSAPVGGARATVEAQGCGYPEFYFRHDNPGSLLSTPSLHSDTSMGWSTLEEMSALLRTMNFRRQQEASHRSRAHYERHFSRARFLAALHQLLPAAPLPP